MPTYEVDVAGVLTVRVEANNARGAKARAMRKLEDERRDSGSNFIPGEVISVDIAEEGEL